MTLDRALELAEFLLHAKRITSRSELMRAEYEQATLKISKLREATKSDR